MKGIIGCTAYSFDAMFPPPPFSFSPLAQDHKQVSASDAAQLGDDECKMAENGKRRDDLEGKRATPRRRPIAVPAPAAIVYEPSVDAMDDESASHPSP
jgi:hypothetical protein